MENSNEKLIRDFFTENKKEISNKDFSNKVMNSLPEKKRIQWIIPVFSLIGFYITLFLIDFEKVFYKIMVLLGHVSPIYFLGFIFSLPFIFLFFWFVNEKKQLHFT
jgi:hypothetical protein